MQKKFKIGIDARMFSDSYTGIGRYTFELTRRFFAKKDLPVEWVIFMNEPEFSRFTPLSPDVKEVCVNAKHYSFAEQTKFLKILNNEQCDLVHFTHFNVPLLYNRPFVVTIHDTTISFYPGKKMNSFLNRMAYDQIIKHAVKSSQKIITVSENTKNDVVKLFQSPSGKIQKIWNGLGNDFSESIPLVQEAVREKFHLDGEFLLYTGVWREHKNLVRLLEAFRQVLDRTKRPTCPSELKSLKLVITGKEDPHYPEVKETVQKLNLQDKVVFAGLVDFSDLVALYSSATAFVFPSLYEGFGFPPLEAMSCNTPVVASKISSIPEVCGDAVHYFNPLSVSDMAQEIWRILTDEDLREKLVIKGRERVKLFSWDTCAEETLKVYWDCLGKK